MARIWPFIGSSGRLVEVPFTASEGTSRDSRVITKVSAEGRRRAVVRPRTSRSWSVSVNAQTGLEAGPLREFVEGAWGGGPWHWVTVEAQHGNLLTPGESILSGVGSQGGAVQLPTGWAPRTSVVSGTAFDGIPVLPGRPVTLSMHLTGSASLLLLNASGATVGSTGLSGSGMRRVSATLTPPASAVSARVTVSGTIARPQVTWTAKPVEWTHGAGCRAAVVTGYSSDLLTAWPGHVLSSASYVIEEVS